MKRYMKGMVFLVNLNNKVEIAKAIQYTNVNPNLTKDELYEHLDNCIKYGFNAAMIAPCWVSLAKDYLSGTGVKVATTLNFPMANDTLKMKLALIDELAKEGADEFDFPPNPGYLIGGMDADYKKELNEVVHLAHDKGMEVKAMLEFGFLNEEQKIKAAQYANESGIDWVKQSSGWGKGGCEATVNDVKIL